MLNKIELGVSLEALYYANRNATQIGSNIENAELVLGLLQDSIVDLESMYQTMGDHELLGRVDSVDDARIMEDLYNVLLKYVPYLSARDIVNDILNERIVMRRRI